MNTRGCVLLLTSLTLALAQDRPATPPKVTIKSIVAAIKYCLGPTSGLSRVGEFQPTDITLRLSLTMLYENHSSATMVVPWGGFHSDVRMAVSGEESAQTVRSFDHIVGYRLHRRRGVNPPEYITPQVTIVPGGKSALVAGDSLDVPVRSSEKQLLGKVVIFSIHRDHGFVPPAVLAVLQTTYRSEGTVWTGTAESETLGISIPEEPETVDCRKDEKF